MNRHQRRAAAKGDEGPSTIPFARTGTQQWATTGSYGPLKFTITVDKSKRPSGALTTVYVSRLFGQPPLERSFNAPSRNEGFRAGDEIVREMSKEYLDLLRRVELARTPENPVPYPAPLALSPRAARRPAAALALSAALVVFLTLAFFFSR
jgi:hypothetical protein